MLSRSLGLSQGDVCSLVGAGGKTSCLYSLAVENPWGKTLLTTTTMMRDPRKEKHPFSGIEIAGREDFRFSRRDSPFFIASREVRKNLDQKGKILAKVKGFPPEIIDLWVAKADWDLTVLEADGAACRSLKMPDEREPLVPPSTTVTIGVIGLDILGQPAGPEQIHRFRLVQERIGIESGEPVSVRHLCSIIDHPEGLFKNSPERAVKILLLNKADALSARKEYTPEQLLRSIRETCKNPDRIVLTILSDYANPIIVGTLGSRS